MNTYGPINDSAFQKAGDVEPLVAEGLRLIDEHPAFQIAENLYKAIKILVNQAKVYKSCNLLTL